MSHATVQIGWSTVTRPLRISRLAPSPVEGLVRQRLSTAVPRPVANEHAHERYAASQRPWIGLVA